MSSSKNISAARPRRAAGRSKPADVVFEHLRKLTAILRGNLEKCATDPDTDPVHDVRTGTRRLQAIIEAILRERGDPSLQELAAEWLVVLKKIRRAAAPVRDLDVHRKLLHKLIKFGSKNEGAELIAPVSEGAIVVGPSPDVVEAPATELSTNPVADQAEKLDAWLHHARQHNAAQLKKKTAKQVAKFDELASAMEAAIQQGRRTRRRPRSAATVALESFARLVNEMQQIDANNLHDFRKEAKKARYLAETAAEDAYALAIGNALKKLQDDIGDWHDWLVLSDEARDALGADGEKLIALLDAERDRHYVLAMKTVNRLRGKLMGEWLVISGHGTADTGRRNVRSNLKSDTSAKSLGE
ncbi:CHAD domain-containing protein [Alloacidobacterium sp.]|uniref:CHAD domain-containing protein n=1 Tax=Alloacidobacterium sp. TaxID=2951999 RepID=UPI002D30E2E5|nr:CHAD domain-containing protein [Alloacidobacterium sp.]HYK37310.1 CHAD domain-containing protein [Alloacidobacterium sp.]